jgi:tetratricopeptide (TPR) repeat protein
MMISAHITKACSAVAALCISLLFLVPFPRNSCASQTFYTVQTGSFSRVEDARNQYDFIINKLIRQEVKYLRIEKVGTFYTVRLGKFQEYADAEKLYRKVKTYISEALIRNVYIKDKRIITLYNGSSTADRLEADDKAASVSLKIEQGSIENTAKKERGQPSKETLASISFLVEKKDFDAALDMIKVEIKAEPEHPDLNAWLGMVLLKKDQPHDALKYLKKAVELSPHVSDYHNGLGYSLIYLKKYDGAIDAFNNALSLDPGHTDARTGLCIGYAKTGNREKALETYNRLKDLDNETSDKLLKIIETTKE